MKEDVVAANLANLRQSINELKECIEKQNTTVPKPEQSVKVDFDEKTIYDGIAKSFCSCWNAQNEWKNEQWSFLIGGRVDKNSIMDKAVFSPRANIRYNPTQDVNIRFSYAEGFRAPQAFDAGRGDALGIRCVGLPYGAV